MTGKERLLTILRLLQQRTDEDHPMTTAEIVAYFTALGIPTDRKTVKEDIDAMIKCGIDIVHTRGRQTRFFYADRPFELAELKLLIDAVEASKFITARKSGELVKKLTSMTSEANAAELQRGLYTAGRIKPENERIYLVVDAIYHAINQERQIVFLYYEYNADRERIPHNNGEQYTFSPYAMLYNEDKYYVLGYSESHEKLVTFRVDRMGVPEVLTARARPKPEGFDPVDYTVNVFSMYDGEMTTVELLCDNDLMNYVIDRFGDEVRTEVVDYKHFRAEAEVSISRTFFAWVFQFSGGVRILGPEKVRKEYRAMLKRASL